MLRATERKELQMTATTTAVPRHPGRLLTASVGLVVGLACGTAVTLIATDDDPTPAATRPVAAAAPAVAPASADAAEHWAQPSSSGAPASADAAEHWLSGP
jgi:hypothetical protein